MALAIGNNAVTGAYLGANQVRRAYKGSSLVFQAFSPASEQEFIQQTAAGGPAQLLKCYGKSVVWRQSFKNYSTAVTSNDVTITPDADGYLTFTGTASADITLHLNGALAGGLLTNGHKVFTGLSVAGGSLTGSGLLNITASSGGGSYSIDTAANFIVSVNASGNSYPRIFIASATAFSTLKIRIVNIDLTDLYGAGNEPTSVAQFLADYPTFDPTYDPGSLQSNKTSELRAYDGGNLRGSLALNLSTLTGKLNGEGASVVVYPDGLRGVGTDRDAAYGSTGEVRRQKITGAGFTLHNTSSAGYKTYKAILNGPTENAFRASQVNTFGITNYGNFDSSSVAEEKIQYSPTPGNNSYIAIAPNRSIDDFEMEYPLATPLTYTLDTPLPTDLTCEQGDILQRVSDNNCPFVGEMKFGL